MDHRREKNPWIIAHSFIADSAISQCTVRTRRVPRTRRRLKSSLESREFALVEGIDWVVAKLETIPISVEFRACDSKVRETNALLRAKA